LQRQTLEVKHYKFANVHHVAKKVMTS